MLNNETYTQPANPRLFYGYIIVILSFLILAVHTGARVVFGIFLLPMLTELNLTRGMISGAFSVSLLVAGSASILIGRFTDVLGPRTTMTISGIFLGIGYLLMSQVNAVWQIYLFYGIIIGLGGNVYVPMSSTIARWFTMRRNLMTGIVLCGGSIGTLITPLLVNWLIYTYDWRISFIALGIIVMLFLIGSAQLLKKDPTKTGQVPYGENQNNTPYIQSKYILPDNELSLRKAVYTKQFLMLAVIFFVIGVCMFSIIVHIAPHAIDQGFSAANAAGIVSVIGGVGILGRIVIGHAGDRFGAKWAILISLALTFTAMICLMLARELWMLYIFAILFGFSFASGAVAAPLIAELFGLRSHGSILGTMNFIYSVGVAVGPLMTGYIFDATHSYQLAFIIVTITALLGIITTLLLKPAITNETN